MPAARASSAPLPTEVSLARIISQGLVPTIAAPDVVAAVARQLAIVVITLLIIGVLLAFTWPTRYRLVKENR